MSSLSQKKTYFWVWSGSVTVLNLESTSENSHRQCNDFDMHTLHNGQQDYLFIGLNDPRQERKYERKKE